MNISRGAFPKQKINLNKDILFNYGENKIDKILYNKVLHSYKYYLNKYITCESINHTILKYSDLEEYFNNQKRYYICTNKIIPIDDNYIIINNSCVTLKNNKNILDDCEEILLKGIILLDNNENWMYSISNIFKYNSKLLISENYHKINDNTIKFVKMNKLQDISIHEYEYIIIDTENLNLDNLNYELNANKIIIRITDKFDLKNIFYLYKILFMRNITNYIFDENKNIKYLDYFYKMEKQENKINVKDLINIYRIKYDVTNKEKGLFEILQNDDKVFDFFDSLGLSFYKNINKNSNDICPICMDKMNENVCQTECGHEFCIGCLSLSLMNSNKCPLCRGKIKTNKIKTNNFNNYSKVVKLLEDIDVFMNDKNEKNILLYMNNNNLSKFVYENIKYKYNVENLCGNNKSKLKKINEINCKNDKYIIILGSKDYIYAKYIYNIGTILITDYKYNFILNKDSLGYSCINNKEPINIFIYEMQIE